MIGTIWTKKGYPTFTFLVIEKNDPKKFQFETNHRYTVLRLRGSIDYGVYVSDERSMIDDDWIRLL